MLAFHWNPSMFEVPWQLQLFIAQMGVSGVLWTAVYVLIIRAGARDETCGMPFAALCANLAWEFIFVFVFPHPWYQLPADVLWLTLDCIIAYQAARYFRASFPLLDLKRFVAMFALGLVTAGCAIGFIGHVFDDPDGVYAAFAQNLMMSVLFVGWLVTRSGLPGQRLSIAVLKMLGTLAASSAFVTIALTDPDMQVRKAPLTPLLAFLFIATLVFDAIYVAGVWRRRSRDDN
ncbi:MAG: hypothetical protein AAF656_12925 [Planctomycetota bacterium]